MISYGVCLFLSGLLSMVIFRSIQFFSMAEYYSIVAFHLLYLSVNGLLGCFHVLDELPKWLSGKNLPANAGDARGAGSTLGSGRSPGGVGVMATHCGILAWRIPWIEEPGGL